MKLTKTVTRKIVFRATDCRLDFMKMNDRWRQIRKSARNQMRVCYWCKHPFENGEMMALAITERGNKVLCQTCGKQLLNNKE